MIYFGCKVVYFCFYFDLAYLCFSLILVLVLVMFFFTLIYLGVFRFSFSLFSFSFYVRLLLSCVGSACSLFILF